MNWMSNIPVMNISPEMSFSDIIVPTMDFIRGAYLTEKLLTSRKKVSASHMQVFAVLGVTVLVSITTNG